MKIPVIFKIELRSIDTFQKACKYLKGLEGLSESFIFQNFIFALIDFTLFEKYSKSFQLKENETSQSIFFDGNNSNFLILEGEDKKDFTEKGIVSIYIEQPVYSYPFKGNENRFQDRIVKDLYIQEELKYSLFSEKDLKEKAPKSMLGLNELPRLIGAKNRISDREIAIDIIDSGINPKSKYLTAKGKLKEVNKNSFLKATYQNSFGNGLAVHSILKSILPHTKPTHIPLSVVNYDKGILVSGALRALCQSISRIPEYREVNGLEPRIINVSFSLGNKNDKELAELLKVILSVALKKRIFIVAPSGYLFNNDDMNVADSIDINEHKNFIKVGAAFYEHISQVKNNQSLDNLKRYLNIHAEKAKINNDNIDYYPNAIFGLGSNDLSLGNSVFSSSLRVLDKDKKIFFANTLSAVDAAPAVTAQITAVLAVISKRWPTAEIKELRSSLIESAIYKDSKNKDFNSSGIVHISSTLSLIKEKRTKAITRTLNNANSDNSVYLIDFQMKEAKEDIAKGKLNRNDFAEAQNRFSNIQKDHDFMEKQRHKKELETGILKIKRKNIVIDDANLSFKSTFAYEQLTYLYPEIKRALYGLPKPEEKFATNFNEKKYFNTVSHENGIEARKKYLNNLTLQQRTLLNDYKYDGFNILNDTINKSKSSKLSEVIKKIFESYDGAIIAGKHNDPTSGSTFSQLSENLKAIEEHGLKIVYIEEFKRFLQPFLDQVHSSLGTAPKIKYSQILIDNYLEIQGDKKLTELVGQLQKEKIEVVGINEEASTSARNSKKQSLRVGLMNASASEIIRSNNDNGSKYLVFVGKNHAAEYKAEDGSIAGLSQILNIPAIHLVNGKWELLLNQKGGKVY